MNRIFALLLAALFLEGCSTGPASVNSDVVSGTRVATLADDLAISITDAGPPVGGGGKRVFGTSCMNKVWDPAPSQENALALMKAQALAQGYNAVHGVEVKSAGAAAVLGNCWASITATGIAYNASQTLTGSGPIEIKPPA